MYGHRGEDDLPKPLHCSFLLAFGVVGRWVNFNFPPAQTPTLRRDGPGKLPSELGSATQVVAGTWPRLEARSWSVPFFNHRVGGRLSLFIHLDRCGTGLLAPTAAGSGTVKSLGDEVKTTMRVLEGSVRATLNSIPSHPCPCLLRGLVVGFGDVARTAAAKCQANDQNRAGCQRP